MRIRGRIVPALAAAGGTALLFAEGALISGWTEAVLLAFIGWCVVTSRGTLGANLLVSLTALSVTTALVDVLLRPVLGPRLHFTPTNVFTRRLPELPLLGRFDPNVRFIGDGYGDIAAISGDSGAREVRRITLHTDEAGFRNEPGADRRPIDLIVLGDSFGAGWGTTQDAIFARFLETKYGRRVYNLSFPASPWEEYLNFAIESPRLAFTERPVLVWTLFAGNDIYEPYGDTWDPASLPWNGPAGAWMQRYRTFRGRSPFRQLSAGIQRRWQGAGDATLRREVGDGRSILFSTVNNEMGTLSREDVERHPNFPKLERTLAAMKDLAARRGVQVTLLVLPTKNEVYRWILEGRPLRGDDVRVSGFAEAVQAACGRVGLRCLDVKPYLIAEAQRRFERSREFLWWRDDTHLNDLGHEAVAAFIAQRVLGIDEPPSDAVAH